MIKNSIWWVILLLLGVNLFSQSQNLIEKYNPAKKDSLRIGPEKNDQLAFIQAGYTLMTPKSGTIDGVLMFLEDSGFDDRNKSGKTIYEMASAYGFAVLSVSTEIPFDFYFSDSSILTAHHIIEHAFTQHQLPNHNIFFLGASLTGHRAMRYIKYTSERDLPFSLNIKGLVICNFTLDWTRKWHQHQRDIRLNRIDLWEPKFMNYIMETQLNGSPLTHADAYHEMSAYSHYDATNRNIKYYKDLAIRAYAEPAINYRLKTYYRTLYDNNTTDIVGFMAEIRLAGNETNELIVIQPTEEATRNKSQQDTWNNLDKEELMNWILSQTKKYE